MPLSLSDQQLSIVVTVAGALPIEKRADFLTRIAATLSIRHGFRFSDADVARAANEALRTLVHGHAADSSAA